MNTPSSQPSTGGGVTPPGTLDARSRGREEVQLCRRDPARRVTSALGELTAGPGWRVAARLVGRRFPAITQSLLTTFGSKKAKDSFLFFCGAIEETGGWKAFQREFAMRLPVLCYHHVGEKLPRSWPLLTVSPKVFRRQIEWLARHGYTGIHASDWLAWMRQGTALPEKPVLITFDDGYSDLVEHAIPVLEEFGFKATIFIVSQHMGAASTWDVPLGHPSRPLMTAEQVRDCPSHGIEIGAHSRTHPDLRTLPDAALRTELDGSRAELSELMGQPVNTLAYCFGFQNELVRRRAGETFDLSFAAKPGLNAWRTDRTCLRRMFVHPSRVNFALQVKYGIDLHAVWRFAVDRTGRLLRKLLPGRSERPTGSPATATAQVTDVNR